MSNKKLYLYINIIMILWGISWLSAKHIALQFSNIELTFWRFLVTAIFAYLTLVYLGYTKFTIHKKSYIWLVLGGIFMGISQIANFEGLKYGYAGMGSIVFNATSPIFSFVISMIFFNKKFTPLQYFALILGSFGAAMIFDVFKYGFDVISKDGNLYFLANSVLFALVTFCSQMSTRYTNVAVFSLFMGLFASISMLPFCDYDIMLDIFKLDYIFWLNMIFNAGIAGGFGTTLYFSIASKIGGEYASSFIFLVPIVSVIGSSIVFSESINPSSLIGGGIAFLAVYLINANHQKTS
ncbi:MAG: DMT family transporter [Sulfurovaceae bacterium]